METEQQIKWIWFEMSPLLKSITLNEKYGCSLKKKFTQMPIEIWIPIEIRNPIKYDGENFFTTASFGLILLWVVVVSCVAMCVRITLSHSFSPFHSSVLNREMRFIKWRRKTSTAMECTFQAPKKNDIISLAWKRNATQQQHIRRNGNFSWKCSRLVIILNRDHFLSLHLSLSLATLSRLFCWSNRVQFQITMKLKQFVVLFEPFAASDSLWLLARVEKSF